MGKREINYTNYKSPKKKMKSNTFGNHLCDHFVINLIFPELFPILV